MKYQPTIDIWPLSDRERATIQPGQWVRAYPGGPIGRWFGLTRARVAVVAWHAGKAPKGHWNNKCHLLRQYAKAMA